MIDAPSGVKVRAAVAGAAVMSVVGLSLVVYPPPGPHVGKVSGRDRLVNVQLVSSTQQQDFQAAVQGAGATSLWPLQESTGSTATDVINGHNGTISSGVTLGDPGPFPGSSSMAFNGGNCTGIGLDTYESDYENQQESIAAWIFVPSGGQDSASDTILFRWRWYGYQLAVQQPTPGLVSFGVGNSISGVGTTQGFAAGMWHFVIGQFGNGSLDMYVDGVLAATGSYSGIVPYNPGGGVAIGRDGSACDGVNPSFAGRMADVAAFPSALSAPQIAGLCQSVGGCAPVDITQIAGAASTGTGNAARYGHSPRCKDPVNCESGDLTESYNDVSVPGLGAGLDLTRTYNSSEASVDGMFGYGWSSSYSWSLVHNADASVTVTEDDGSQVTATSNGSGGWVVPPWADSSLTENSDGTWSFLRQGTMTYGFDASGQLTSIMDRNGYATSLAYTSGQLSSVTDASGRQIKVFFGSNDLVSKVEDPAGISRTMATTVPGS